MLISACLRRLPVAALLALCTLATPQASAADLSFHWEDEFTVTEQRKLRAWLTETHDALQELVGALPMTTHLYMHRTQAREPVPWANTERSSRQGVHFHVDPGFTLAEFRADWTAPHELSHLVLPYLGRDSSWFAEGFASYLQYRVMEQMGVLSAAAAAARHKRNHDRAASRYPHHNQPFAAAAPRLRAARNYATMYWGGAAYFLQVAAALPASATEDAMLATLRAYVACCRKHRDNLEHLVAELDRLAGGRVFLRTLQQFRREPGFPSYYAPP